jgi:hypothetical protein
LKKKNNKNKQTNKISGLAVSELESLLKSSNKQKITGFEVI